MEQGCYAVIFHSRPSGDRAGYEAMAENMLALARRQPGFLGVVSYPGEDGSVTISYWRDRAAIEAWGRHPEHLRAQAEGKARWYDWFRLEIARVETCRHFDRDPE
jgi:heme-degrading monooxygenase HmoA